ncbi:MAG: IS66 family transposase [Bdellovibrionales bacterium]|nr:IS66 family transposase [Bdellovibrionales bacterium]
MSIVAENLSHEELVRRYYEQQDSIQRQQVRIQRQQVSIERQQEELHSQQEEIEALKRQNEWYRRQYFGQKSERLLRETSSGQQLYLGEGYEAEETPPPVMTAVKPYERSHRQNEVKFSESESKLKFDERVPVEVVQVSNPALEGLSEDEYEVIGEEVAHKLAQSPGAYRVIKYVRPVVKIKSSGKISTAPVTRAASVIERGIAEVSFITGLLLDKFQYHLPLYRQHQRLSASGVFLNRMTLTNIVHRAGQLLEPIYRSLQSSVLLSHVLAVDETPIKVGRKVKGKMHQGYLWGMYGDKDELAFLYSPSRSGELLRKHLGEFVGTLLTDGYRVYERFVAQREAVIHAQCWVHARRKFIEAQATEPELANQALGFIAVLYQGEKEYSKRERSQKAQPVVDQFFLWLRTVFQTHALLPSNPFTKAASYALERERALRVFLEDEKVAIDTNHLERQIRPVAIGRKNWLFHWTEVGAEYAACIQSLIASCTLHDIDPYTYFVDVLQRIDSHPMHDIHLLTPRIWKEHFADNPLRSDSTL